MRSIVWLSLCFALAAPAAAKEPSRGANVWYRHSLPGGGENGDWLCVHQQGAAVQGCWFRKIGDSRCDLFLVKARTEGRRWVGVMWEPTDSDPLGAHSDRLHFTVSRSNGHSAAPAVGDSVLLFGENAVRFVKTAPPQFYRALQGK